MLLALIPLLACTTGSDPSAPDAAAPAVDPVGFTLAFSGNVDGEIEPCG